MKKLKNNQRVTVLNAMAGHPATYTRGYVRLRPPPHDAFAVTDAGIPFATLRPVAEGFTWARGWTSAAVRALQASVALS